MVTEMTAVDNPMTGSILKYLRQILVGNAEDKSFDNDLILYGNGALGVIGQLGVGPANGFQISGENETWEELIGERTDLAIVQMDVVLRVRLMFDPPQNSFLVKAIQEQIVENDWRIEIWHKPPHDIQDEVMEE